MILNVAQQSVRASIKRSLSRREPQGSIDVRDHHLRERQMQGEAGLPLAAVLLIARLRNLQRKEVQIQLLQQVHTHPGTMLHKYLLIEYTIAAAAAKINAQIQAKKGIQHADVPPIRAAESPVGKSASPGAGAGNSASNINGEMYIADGDYIKDIEVNDLRNRYTLTKGSTQKMVNTPCVILH